MSEKEEEQSNESDITKFSSLDEWQAEEEEIFKRRVQATNVLKGQKVSRAMWPTQPQERDIWDPCFLEKKWVVICDRHDVGLGASE